MPLTMLAIVLCYGGHDCRGVVDGYDGGTGDNNGKDSCVDEIESLGTDVYCS